MIFRLKSSSEHYGKIICFKTIGRYLVDYDWYNQETLSSMLGKCQRDGKEKPKNGIVITGVVGAICYNSTIKNITGLMEQHRTLYTN